MKKKVLYGVAAALFAWGGMGTLQSCKDDLSDLRTQTKYDLFQLRNDLQSQLDDLQGQINANRNDIDKLLPILDDYAKLSYLYELIFGTSTPSQADLDALKNNGGLLDMIQGALDEIQNIKNNPGKDGADGKDGKDGVDGKDGADGKDGKDGVDGKDGADGKDGKDGVDGKDGADGKDGKDGKDGVDGKDGADGKDGKDGADGKDGKDAFDWTDTIEKIKKALWPEGNMDAPQNNIEILAGRVGINEATINLIKSFLEGYLDPNDEQGKTLKDLLDGLQNEITNVNTDLTNLRSEYDALVGEGGRIALIENELAAFEPRLKKLEEEVEAVKTQLKDIIKRIDALVTGILIQATDNPIFGNFSLPIGVKNNMLFNWYGYNKSTIKNFPNNSNNYAYNDELAGVDFSAIKAPVEPVQQGFMGKVNLGRVYLTVNPIGHDFDNTKFTLETSKGTPLPFGIEITPSNDELFFGYTRGADNGFYAADVTIDGDQDAINRGVNATRLTIDDGLKSAVKDVLKDRTKRNALNLLKAIYGQISNQLPAYAVRYDWTDASGKSYAVLSNYDLAIACAKPLSYQFYYGESIDHKLRTFGHISNFILKLKEEGKLHFTFDPITFKDISIELPEINITPKDVVPGEDSKVTVKVGVIKVYEAGHVGDSNYLIGETEDLSFDAEGVDSIVDDLAGKINASIKDITSQIKEWSETANNDLTNQVKDALNPVAEQINKMMDSINGQIDKKLEDIGNQFQPWFNRLNRVIDLYDKVANKINDILDDPNHLLQVAMFYQGGRAGINIVSNSKSDPTVFNAGKGYVGLYASSYTAELVAPAYKKYVAVSNVYKKVKENGKTVVKQADNAAALIAKANSSDHFNEVMDGCTIRYYIPTENLETGLIYEIVYQGLDFHGMTSTQKFYITVK